MYEPVGRGKEDVFVRVATSIMSRFDRFVQGGGWAAGVDFRDGILGHRPKMVGKLVKFRQVQYCRTVDCKTFGARELVRQPTKI